tara:strand:- start:693 stop:1964 length:1272 start_codon:yes stop_codon:yes gene_type:complete
MNELPNDNKAERGVLGSILLDPLPSFSKITISKDDFFTHKNQVLFEQLKDMYVNNLLLDIITIRNYLKDNKKLDVIGGGDYLLELQEEIIIPNHVKHYQEIIKEKSKLRKEIKILKKALVQSYNGESCVSEVISNLSLSDMDLSKDVPLHTLGEKFIEDCKTGNTGTFNWWCPQWDASLGKMKNELMLLHAPRSTGKTALMLQWIVNAHKQKHRVPLASIEMLRSELMPRLIAHCGSVNTYFMRTRGHATRDELKQSKQANDNIKLLELCVRDKAMSIDDIRAWAISESRKGADCIFVDNLLSINDGGKQYQSKTVMYDYFIRKFRDLRDDLNIPIIILAHPNENMQIAWSRDVENFADVILLLHSVGYDGIDVNGRMIEHKNYEGDHVIAKFQKNRQGLSPVASLSFDKRTQTFTHKEWELE